MPCISQSYNPVIGPILRVLLTRPAVFRQFIVPSGGAAHTPPAPPPAPHPPVFLSGALIDTGASITSVTAAVAAQANLPLIGKRSLQTAGGTINANVYVADVAIPMGPLPPAPPGTQVFVPQLNAVPFESMVLLEFSCNSPNFNMLLGRDILCRGILNIGFDGRFTFSI